MLFFLFLQNIITELCRNVRTPDLDKWEEIKKLKASLWALVCNKHFCKIFAIFRFFRFFFSFILNR